MQEQAAHADLRYREHAANLIAYPRVSEDETQSPRSRIKTHLSIFDKSSSADWHAEDKMQG